MTIPGSGLTGSVGGPQQASSREIETTAWTMINKSALGIMPDTLEVPFSKLGGDVMQYKSDPGRPTLTPQGTLRTAKGEDGIDDSWKGPFEQLVNRLPPQTKNRLVDDMYKPHEMRNGNYVVLENTLLTTAKGLAWLEQAQKPVPLDSPEMERMHHNQGLAGRALRGAAQQSGQILGGAHHFLNKVGPNFAGHDNLRGFAMQGAELQEELDTLLQEVRQGAEPDTEHMTELANRATDLSNLFSRTMQGKNLQILSPMLQTLAAVASAMSLTPTTPALFFGLKMASTGLFKKDSASGLLGSELEALLQSLTGGLQGKLLQGAGSAKQKMLMMLLLGTLAGAGTLGSLLAEFGVGSSPGKSEGDERAAKKLTLALIVQMLTGTELLKSLGQTIGEASGCSEKGSEFLGKMIELLMLLTLTLSASGGNEEQAIGSLEELSAPLESDLDALELEAKEAETLLGKGLDVAAMQAQIAIKSGHSQALVEALKMALSLAETTPDLLKEDLEEFDEFAKLLQKSCQTNNESSTAITGMLMAG